MKYKILKMKWTRRMALSVLSALLISMAGCGYSEVVRDTEAVEEDISQQDERSSSGQDEAISDNETKSTETKEDQDTPGESSEEKEDWDTNAENRGEIKEDKIMHNYEIEIFCPEEYIKKNADAKYSDVIKTTYYSTTCEKERPVNIVLPVGYSEEKEYPVLYVLHGIFGSQNDMNNNSITIQNMMTEGIAKDMIVVYPYMYASKTKDACTAIDKENVAAYDNFVNDLVTDLMPFIKENYSIAEGRENTAIAGFSMGGRESLAIGLQKPDLFGYVGAIAPAPGLVPGKDWAMEHEGQFTEDELVFNDEKPLLLMVCCGDKDGTVGQFPKSYHDIFDRNEVEHVWWEIPGSDHGDPAISSGIYNFCKYIFQ